MWYDVGASTIVITHPQLLLAEETRQKAEKAMKAGAKRWPGGTFLPIPSMPIKFEWKVTQWQTMTEADWNALVTDIADRVTAYQYSFAP